MKNQILTIEGFPYYFTTQGITGVSTWNSDPDTPGGASALAGYLERITQTITDEIDPTTAELRQSSIQPILHDFPTTVGGSTVFPLTYYLTKTRDQLTFVPLAASCTSSGNFTVNNPTVISGLMPCVLWIEDEAILCDSVNTGTGVVTVNTRGYYGTNPAAHTIDTSRPTRLKRVFAHFPRIIGRRAILWTSGETGSVGDATPLRRYIVAECSPNQDLMRFTLDLKPILQSYNKRKIGSRDATTTVRGYDLRRIKMQVTYDGGTRTPNASSLFNVGITKVKTSLNAALNAHVELLDEQFVVDETATPGKTVQALTGVDQGGAYLAVRTNFTDNLSIAFWVGDQEAYSNSYEFGATNLYGICYLQPPSASILVNPDGDYIPISSTNGLSNSSATLDLYGNYTVATSTILKGDYNEDCDIEILPAQASPIGTSDDLDGAYYYGMTRFVSKNSGIRVNYYATIPNQYMYRDAFSHLMSHYAIDNNVRLQQIISCSGEHWVFCWQNIIENTNGAYDHRIDSRDWSFTRNNEIASRTVSHNPSRDYSFDGSTEFSELISGELLMSGSCIGLGDNGTYNFTPVTKPSPITPYVDLDGYTVRHAIKRPHWEISEKKVVSRVTITIGKASVECINDDVEIEGIETKIQIDGMRNTNYVLDNPENFADQVSSLIFGYWSNAVNVYVIQCVSSLETTVYPGKIVRFTTSIVPNSAGGRTARVLKALVIKTENNLKTNVLSVHCVVFRDSIVIAPAIRINAIAGDVVTAEQNYTANSTDDYAASDDPSYTGTGNDRGVGRFSAGQHVKIVKRDTTSTVEETDLIVLSVDTGAQTITLTTSPSTTIGADKYDLVLDDSDTTGISSLETQYAYCGGDTVISPSFALQEWEP